MDAKNSVNRDDDASAADTGWLMEVSSSSLGDPDAAAETERFDLPVTRPLEFLLTLFGFVQPTGCSTWLFSAWTLLVNIVCLAWFPIVQTMEDNDEELPVVVEAARPTIIGDRKSVV